jgi:hypothetical protein
MGFSSFEPLRQALRRKRFCPDGQICGSASAINRSLRQFAGFILTSPHSHLGKCDSEQARAEEEKTGNSYSEETVRSEFFTCHGTPPTARQCWLPPAIGSFRLAARLERLRLMTQLDVGTRPIPKGIGRVIRRFVTCLSRPIILDVQACPIAAGGPHKRPPGRRPLSCVPSMIDSLEVEVLYPA